MKYWEESLYLALEALPGEKGMAFYDSLTSDEFSELAQGLETSAEMRQELNSYPSQTDLIDEKIRGVVRNYEDELSRRNSREKDYEIQIERLEFLLRQARNKECSCD